MHSRYQETEPSLYKIVDALGFLEKKVLFLVEKQMKVRDVLLLLNSKNKKYAYTTIMTVMDNLFKKGFLFRIKKGKTYYYFPSIENKLLKAKTAFYLTRKLINLFSPFQIIKNLLFLLVIFPASDLIYFFLKTGFLNGVFLALLIIFFLNLIFQWYLNGFFEYLFLLKNEPKIFLYYFPTNFFYLQENLLIVIALLIIVGIFYFLKKSVRSFLINTSCFYGKS